MSNQFTKGAGIGCGVLPDGYGGGYECVCGQCNVPTFACTVCDKPKHEHGSYPTCASHPYTDSGRCGAVGTSYGRILVGLPCPGAECRNGCVRAFLSKATGES